MSNPASIQIWSAAPSPLTTDLTVDVVSVGRMIEDAIATGIAGLFLAGTCGEGAVLTDGERFRLVEAAAKAAAGRLTLAVQVTDNSVPRILENIRQAADAGADLAIMAAPASFTNFTPERITALFIEAADASPLPVGIYDLGRKRPVRIPESALRSIYLRPKVQLVKDSSVEPSRCAIALAVRNEKPTLRLFNGDEFNCLKYLEAGYDGVMFGGAAAMAPYLRQIADLYLAGRIAEARAIDDAMKQSLYGIYGGEDIACWLSGLKYYLVRRGIFSSAANYHGYPLTDDCRRFIDAFVAQSNGGEPVTAAGHRH